jgi:5-methylcytosine-specific restriction endonuclease McrA
MLDLHFGYQLECRFCKKFFVNRPLNKKRSTAQMKEDGQRRRNFELLITELHQKSAQLSYRHKTGRELTNDIWDKFEHKCFKCGTLLPSSNLMHLDHTRPLALLWPLDETATALCSTCNGAKRDKPPSEFYSNSEMEKLSKYTGLSIAELKSQEPNRNVILELLNKLDWFYNEFLNKPELLKEKEGKVTAELIVKALDKVLSRSKVDKYEFSFVKEFNVRRDNSNK